MTSNLHQLLGDLVSVNNRLTRIAARAAGGGTESPAIWRTLSVLTTSGPMRLGALAAHSRVSQPTATKLVASLAERGWVKRLADATDARATQTAITPAGEAALAAWRNKLANAMLPLFRGLSETEVDTLERAVAIVRERVETTERGTEK